MSTAATSLPLRFSLWIAAFAASGLLTACGPANAESGDVRVAPDLDVFYVELDTARAVTATDTIELVGTVASDEEAKPSFKTGGIVATLHVKEGDRVRRGQTIGRLNLTEIDAQVAQAELGLEKARRDRQRVENLYRDSVATREQYQNTQTALELAERQLEIARFNRTYSVATAPISGTVVRRLVNPGEVVGPGQPLVLIQGTGAGDWVVRASLTDEQWARVEVGDPAEIRFDAYPDWILEGKLSDLGTIANPTGGTFPAEFTLSGNNRRLAAGLVARVRLALPFGGNTESVRIPLPALAEADGQSARVFVPGPDDRVAERIITLGRIEDGWVEVTDGLRPGEVVVTTGAPWLRAGDRIAVSSRRR
jgi:RND family efflux transporter MFP subunit